MTPKKLEGLKCVSECEIKNTYENERQNGTTRINVNEVHHISE